MNKFLHSILLFAFLLFSSIGFAQHKSLIKDKLVSKEQIKNFKKQINKRAGSATFSMKRSARPLAPGDCQFIEPAFTTFSVLTDDSDGDGTDDSYVVGTNAYEDQGKAEFFDFSASATNNYLNGAIIYFADATADDLDYTKIVPIRVFDGSTGTPGAELGHVDLTLQEISDSLLSDTYDGVPVDFTNLAIPASKKIFIAVDMSNLDYYMGDWLALYSSNWDELTPNTAWEKWSDGLWYAFSDAGGWGGNVSIAMVPLIGETNTCARIIPIKFASFTAEKFGTDNKINWQVANSFNCKGFEIEKSTDGINFRNMGFVSFNNDISSYSFIDNNGNGLNYYRIKEIDNNGNTVYSKIISLRRSLNTESNYGIVQLYPTVSNSDINVIVNANTNELTKINIYDIAGKLILSRSLHTNGTNQLVNINTSALTKGTYIVKLMNNTVEKSVERFVKK